MRKNKKIATENEECAKYKTNDPLAENAQNENIYLQNIVFYYKNASD